MLPNKAIFDAEASVTLRADGSGAVTAAGQTPEAGISLNDGVAYWQVGDESLPYNMLVVNVQVSAIDFADLDEMYDIAVQTDADQGFTTAPVTHGQLTAVPGTGVFKLILDADTVRRLDPDAAFIRIQVDLGGTTPSIDYHAWLTAH